MVVMVLITLNVTNRRLRLHYFPTAGPTPREKVWRWLVGVGWASATGLVLFISVYKT